MRTTARSQRRLGLESLECRNLLAALGPELVADLNQSPDFFVERRVVHIGDTTLFVANSPTNGTEFFTSDGTDEGSRLWADLNPGFASSDPTDVNVAPNGEFGVFVATMGDGRDAIWHTDGTDAVPVLMSGNRDDDLEVLSITDKGAYMYRGFEHDDEFGGRSTYISDVWFVDGETKHPSFIRSLGGEVSPGQVIARNDDGHMLFENCVVDNTDCTIWSTDGTYHNTFELAGYERSAELFKVGGDLFFRERFIDAITPTFRYESGESFVSAESEILNSRFLSNPTLITANDSGILTSQITGEPGSYDSQLVFAKSLNDEPVVVAQGGNVSLPSVVATESALMSVVSIEDGAALLSVDQDGTANTIFELETASAFHRTRVLANDGQRVVLAIHYTTDVDGAVILSTDGTADGTRELVVSPDIGGGRFEAEIIDDKIWVLQASADRSITVFADGQSESTITDQWSSRTAGSSQLGIEPFKDGYVVNSSRGVWQTDAALDNFDPLVQLDRSIGRVFVFPDKLWYELPPRPGEPRTLWENQGTAESNEEVLSQIPGFTGYADARMIGDKMVLLAGGTSGSFGDGTEVWTSDGTIEGTTKVYENSEALLNFIAPGFGGSVSHADDVVIEVRPNDAPFAQREWLLSDGTPSGTRPVGADERPSSDVTHQAGGFTYTYTDNAQSGTWTATAADSAFTLEGNWRNVNSFAVGNVVFFTARVDDEFGLYRILPGIQYGTLTTSPVIERHFDLPLEDNTLEFADDDLVVLYDNGQLGPEPHRISTTSEFASGSHEASCTNALELQQGINQPPPQNPVDIFRLDINGDFQLDPSDLDEWAQRANAKGDVNFDGSVGAADLNIVGGNWNSRVDNGWCDGDLNGDGIVSALDLNEVGENWPSPDEAIGLTKGRALRAPLAQIAPANYDLGNRAELALDKLFGESNPITEINSVPSPRAVESNAADIRALDSAVSGIANERSEHARVFSLDASSQDRSDADAKDELRGALRRSWRLAMARR